MPQEFSGKTIHNVNANKQSQRETLGYQGVKYISLSSLCVRLCRNWTESRGRSVLTLCLIFICETLNKNDIFIHLIGSMHFNVYIIHTSYNLQGQRATLPLNNHRFVVRAECLNTLPTYHMREAKQKRYSYKVAL